MSNRNQTQNRSASETLRDRIADRLGFLMAMAWLNRIGSPPHPPNDHRSRRRQRRRRGIDSEDAHGAD